MSKACWCGNQRINPFGGGYDLCTACTTLICHDDLPAPPPSPGGVDAAEAGYYGEHYWFEHQQQDLGLPPLHVRARQDLTERNLHWLATLLSYRQPPARVMELGCSHGGFVAILRQAGYDACGVEMSPAIVAYGQKTFGVQIQLGPVECLDLPASSVDIIVMMDVLEHLPDPTGTLAHCIRLLAEDGVLLIQTPEYMHGLSYERLLQEQSRFQEMMIPQEHLFLYSRASVSKLLAQVGLLHTAFEKAIFSHYDMFLVASRGKLEKQTQDLVESTLLASPGGRLTLAMLDLRNRELALTRQLAESEADRAARLACMQTLEKLLQEATGRLTLANLDFRKRELELTQRLAESEEDRAARLVGMQTLEKQVLEARQQLERRGAANR